MGACEKRVCVSGGGGEKAVKMVDWLVYIFFGGLSRLLRFLILFFLFNYSVYIINTINFGFFFFFPV